MKRIVLTGGGSGGHFYPLIAVAEKLKREREKGAELSFYYFGPEPYDASLLKANNIKFVRCSAGKQRKYRSILNFFDFFRVLWGIITAIVKLYILYPDVIFSKGSYTSVPVVVAGFLLRIPIVVHESDTKPGSANRLGGRFARYIAISFDDAVLHFPQSKTALTGIPLREAFIETQSDPFAVLGLPPERPLIFVTGGSQGAERLNNLVLESLDELLPAFTVLHQSGTVHEQNVQATAASLITDSALLERYFVKGSLTVTEMNAAMSAASLIVSRAGSGTLFEIAQKGRPSILVPIPEDISHDQTTNAYAYARAGAASVLEERNITDGLLVSEITRIMGNDAVYAAMSEAARAFARTDAADTIAQILVQIGLEH